MPDSVYKRGATIGFVVYMRRHGSLCEVLPVDRKVHPDKVGMVLYNALSYETSPAISPFTVGGTLFPTREMAKNAINKACELWNASLNGETRKYNPEEFIVHKVSCYPNKSGHNLAKKLIKENHLQNSRGRRAAARRAKRKRAV